MTRPAVWLTALLAVAACSPATPAVDGPPARDVRVGLDEYEVRMSHPAVLPGTVTIEITNAGREAHDLRVEGAGEPISHEPLRPGETGHVRLQVPPDANELLLWCTLPGHRAQGMTTIVPVGTGEVGAESQPDELQWSVTDVV